MRKRVLMLLMGCFMAATVLTGCETSYSVTVGGKEIISSDKKDEPEETELATTDNTEAETEIEETAKEETAALSKSEHVVLDGVQMDSLVVSDYNALGYVEIPDYAMDAVVFTDSELDSIDKRVYVVFTCDDSELVTFYDEYLFGDSETAKFARQTFAMLNEQYGEEMNSSDTVIEFREDYIEGKPALIVSQPVNDGGDGNAVVSVSMNNDALIMLAVADRNNEALDLMSTLAKSIEYNGKEKDFSGLTDLSKDARYYDLVESFGSQLGEIGTSNGAETTEDATSEISEETTGNIDIGNGPWKDLVAEMVQQPWYRALACFEGKAIVGAISLSEFEEIMGTTGKLISNSADFSIYDYDSGSDAIRYVATVDNESNIVRAVELHGPEDSIFDTVAEIKAEFGEPSEEESFYISYGDTTDLGDYSVTMYLDESGENIDWISIDCYKFDK